MRSFFKLFLLLLTCFCASGQQINSADSVYVIRDSVLIQTRDGVSISATVVWRKGNVQPLPTILFFTTYYQGPGDAVFAKRSADRGYVGIVAYSRGIRTDLKHYAPYENDGNDVYDVIDWISKQPWSNGKVGMFGGSYTGFVQWSTLRKVHPALKTVVPQVAVMPGYDTPMENNVTVGFALNWPNDNIYKRARLPQDLNMNWWEKGTSYRSLDSLAGQKNDIFQKWLQHPAYNAYWKSMVPSPQQYANLTIPILATTGYYDGSQIGALKYLRQYYQYNKNPNLYFVIGPYDHWGGQRKAASNIMGYQIDTVANIDMRELAYQWLDYILKDGKKPEILKDKINYEVMGANEWRHAATLEGMTNGKLRFYLGDSKKEHTYSLLSEPPKKRNFMNQTVDFKDRENQNNYFTPFIILDSLDQSNGLAFVSQVFDKPFSINGSFAGNLKVAINKKDMDVSIAFYELMPDGKYFYLTRYLGRASYAKDDSKRQLLTPNKETIIPFDNTRLVSKQISKGSRLVIVLNVNKHPFEVINYGSGKDVNDETIGDAGEPLKIKWFNDSFVEVGVWR